MLVSENMNAQSFNANCAHLWPWVWKSDFNSLVKHLNVGVWAWWQYVRTTDAYTVPFAHTNWFMNSFQLMTTSKTSVEVASYHKLASLDCCHKKLASKMSSVTLCSHVFYVPDSQLDCLKLIYECKVLLDYCKSEPVFFLCLIVLYFLLYAGLRLLHLRGAQILYAIVSHWWSVTARVQCRREVSKGDWS